MRFIIISVAMVALSACGKQGVIVPPNNKPAVKNTYPAQTCLDKLVDIRQSKSCQ